jgi:hypothetical protein
MVGHTDPLFAHSLVVHFLFKPRSKRFSPETLEVYSATSTIASYRRERMVTNKKNAESTIGVLHVSISFMALITATEYERAVEEKKVRRKRRNLRAPFTEHAILIHFFQ